MFQYDTQGKQKVPSLMFLYRGFFYEQNMLKFR